MTGTLLLRVKNVVLVPEIAWPTIILLLACVMIHVSTALAFSYLYISSATACVACSISAYMAFTPMHDASHRSVANHQYSWVNDFVGVISSLMFPIPFHGFKSLHLQHHKHTNDHDLDPDAFAGEGPSFLLPIHWVLMESRYYYLGIPMAFQKWQWQVYFTVEYKGKLLILVCR